MLVSRLAALSLLALSTCCVTVTVRTVVAADGSAHRSIRVEANSPLAIDQAVERFPEPWRIRREDGAAEMTAEIELGPGQVPEPDETGLTVERSVGWFFTTYRYREDFSRIRLGRAAPTIAPVPPARSLLPVLLLHERNIAVLEKRARQAIKVRVEAELPGSLQEGNWDGAEGARAQWDFDFHAPAAPWAESRIVHRGWVAGTAVAALVILALLVLLAGRYR